MAKKTRKTSAAAATTATTATAATTQLHGSFVANGITFVPDKPIVTLPNLGGRRNTSNIKMSPAVHSALGTVMRLMSVGHTTSSHSKSDDSDEESLERNDSEGPATTNRSTFTAIKHVSDVSDVNNVNNTSNAKHDTQGIIEEQLSEDALLALSDQYQASLDAIKDIIGNCVVNGAVGPDSMFEFIDAMQNTPMQPHEFSQFRQLVARQYHAHIAARIDLDGYNQQDVFDACKLMAMDCTANASAIDLDLLNKYIVAAKNSGSKIIDY